MHLENQSKGSIDIRWYEEKHEIYKELLDTMV